MTNDNLLPFCFPAVCRKKITAAFDGGRISSDGGVMLLAQADRRLGIAERLAQAIPDARDPDRVTHLLPDILRARIFAIACGYEDANDLDRLRFDPAFKLACGRLPDSDRNLCSQPTVSRWENAPSLRDLIRLMGVMIDLYCASYTKPPESVTLGIDFIFGLPGNTVLDRLVDQTADDIRTRRALDQKPCLRGFAETSYQAKSWNTDRRACARIEATTKGLDIRFVVTSIETGSAEH